MYYRIIIQSICLALCMLLVGGCWWAGSGTMHVPIDTIRCGKPWTVRVMYQNDPKDWRVNLKKESTNFRLNYRVGPSGEYIAVPMVAEKLEPKIGRAYLKADMPSVSCDKLGEYVEYYYDHTNSYSNSYNKSNIYRAAIKY